MTTMTTDSLKNLLNDADARIKDLDHLMATTPTDTVAYAAMVESRPGLINFRNAIDNELDRRGF